MKFLLFALLLSFVNVSFACGSSGCYAPCRPCEFNCKHCRPYHTGLLYSGWTVAYPNAFPNPYPNIDCQGVMKTFYPPPCQCRIGCGRGGCGCGYSYEVSRKARYPLHRDYRSTTTLLEGLFVVPGNEYSSDFYYAPPDGSSKIYYFYNNNVEKVYFTYDAYGNAIYLEKRD